MQAPGASATAKPTMAAPLPNPVGKVAKVKRPGAASTPTVSAPAVGFGSKVVYPDGVQLVITKATKATEQGNGPGVFTGREYVNFTIELTNGTAKQLDLNEVVLTTFYGKTRQLAAPVYAEGTGARDFSGTVKPGAKTTATYAFAVPVTSLGAVTMVVDFDGAHTSAEYTGSVATS